MRSKGMEGGRTTFARGDARQWKSISNWALTSNSSGRARTALNFASSNHAPFLRSCQTCKRDLGEITGSKMHRCNKISLACLPGRPTVCKRMPPRAAAALTSTQSCFSSFACCSWTTRKAKDSGASMIRTAEAGRNGTGVGHRF